MKRNLVFVLAIFMAACAFAQERQIVMPNKPQPTNNIAEAESGYWCAIDIGGGSTAMEGMKNVAFAGASFTNGYRVSQYLKIGAGLGILYYLNNSNVRDRKSHLAMPLFINARGNILSGNIRKTVPYWSANVGVAIPDGFFMTPTVGLRIGEKRSAWLVGLGYTLRHLKTCPDNKDCYSGAMVKIGYEF